MALADDFERQGNFLFKNRGLLPIGVLVLALCFRYFQWTTTPFSDTKAWDGLSESWALLLSLAGLAIRVYTVGFTPKNTSGRNTGGQVAESLNTTGSYSLVRHPLYLGNYLIWLGLALFVQNLWFILIFSLLFWLYYERIMWVEERFLRDTFGDRFQLWAARTPAFIPKVKGFKKSPVPFNWKKVLRKEKNGILAIFLVIWLIQLFGALARAEVFSARQFLENHGFWTWALISAGGFYLLIKWLTGRILRPPA